ncbi:MAG: thermonuclease family protein [Sedimentisphaerales bacterium]
MTDAMVRYAMSRGRRNLVAVAAALLAMAVVALDHSCVRPALVNRGQSAASQDAADLQKYEGKQFTVAKVVDGDTLDIDIPDGNYSHTRIRLWGIDTPETKDPRTGPMYYGQEASDFATQAALGKRVTIHLEPDRKTRDKYHRLLAYVQLPNGTFLNEVLLSEGYAYADLRFKHSLYNKYKQLEGLARKQKKGLWEKVAPEQMPQWRQQRLKLTTDGRGDHAKPLAESRLSEAETAEVNN